MKVFKTAFAKRTDVLHSFSGVKRVLTAALLAVTMTASAQISRPKLIVGLVVDQMRWDYLYYYYDQYGQGGLRRLVDNGYSFENCMINYLPTITAVGHSCIYTGSFPALTGIASNSWIEWDKPIYCCQDSNVNSVGSSSAEGQMSPHRMQATTIGDQLKLATDFKSKVIGIALKDRAAILPAGHSADAAYWWDTSAGHYVTSSYYMDALPDWVNDFNKQHQQKPGTNVKTSDLGVTLTFQMAEAALKNEKLGNNGQTDMLCISVSSTDAIGHTYGTRGKENKSVYMTLDQELEKFLNTLDQTVGRGNYLLFLSADHGAEHNHNMLSRHHIPAAGIETGELAKNLNEYLAGKWGLTNKAVLDIHGGRVFLNHGELAAHGVKIADARQEVADYLLRDPRIRFAVDPDKVAQYTIPEQLKTRIINGYFRGRSGDVFYIQRPNWVEASNSPDYIGTNHAQWNPYDAHIPFVMFGWNVEHGQDYSTVYIQDIAATVCAMLHIQRPNCCVGVAREMD